MYTFLFKEHLQRLNKIFFIFSNPQLLSVEATFVSCMIG